MMCISDLIYGVDFDIFGLAQSRLYLANILSTVLWGMVFAPWVSSYTNVFGAEKYRVFCYQNIRERTKPDDIKPFSLGRRMKMLLVSRNQTGMWQLLYFLHSW